MFFCLFFFIEDTREMELFFLQHYCSAEIHCRWSRGRDFQSHNVSTESYLLCNSTSSLNIKIFQIWREPSQRLVASNCLHKRKMKNTLDNPHSSQWEELSPSLACILFQETSLLLYFQSTDSLVCLSMCVCVWVCCMCVWTTEAGNLWKCYNQEDDEEHADGTCRLIKTY